MPGPHSALLLQTNFSFKKKKEKKIRSILGKSSENFHTVPEVKHILSVQTTHVMCHIFSNVLYRWMSRAELTFDAHCCVAQPIDQATQTDQELYDFIYIFMKL